MKELRETRAGLKIVKRKPLSNKLDLVEKALIECNELISIFVTSINTAKKNLDNENKNRKKKNDDGNL